MKKKILLLMGVFSLGLLQAQVGVNTTNPQGIFHIDGKANNAITPIASQLTDDFVVKYDGSGGVGVGLGTIPAQGASVDLASPNRGLQLNTVALTGASDLSTVPSPVQGMVVYNTSENTELYPGICTFNGQTNKWEQMAFTKETFDVQIAVSLDDATTTPIDAGHIGSGGYAGVVIPFALLGSSTQGITIGEDGTYSFALNLMGMVDTPFTTQLLLYLFMVRKSDMVIMDAAALATLALNNPTQFRLSTSAILTSELKEGDEIEFMLCHNDGTPYPWTLFGGATTTAARYNKTSLSFWKL